MVADMSIERSLGESSNGGDKFLDWRGRPCRASKHGGMRASARVLGLLALEVMAAAAVGNNLITYVFNEMHYSLSESANIVTNFVGTSNLLSLVGGFLADSYLGSFNTIFIFGFIELFGYILLSIQAHDPRLRPPPCNMEAKGNNCIKAEGFQAFTFYLALYLVALGGGCIKSNIACLGANQFRKQDPSQSKKLSTYFNLGYFSVQTALLVALTVLVWVQTRVGMDVGFAVSSIIMLLGMISVTSGIFIYRNNPPAGNIFTSMAQVLVAAVVKRKQSYKQDTLLNGTTNYSTHGIKSVDSVDLVHTARFRFLDKSCIRHGDDGGEESGWRLSTVNQVEEMKILISVIPIFACTIIFNTILAQLQTFTVQQGKIMDRHITKTFQTPPASLQSILCLMLIILVPVYEKGFIPLARKFTKLESGISALQRIGVGLILSPFSMVAAALVEEKRRHAALMLGKTISIFWIIPQFLIFGVAEMFTSVGLIEFFYKQSLGRIQSFLIAISYCSYSFGYFLSSLLVSCVNEVTATSSGKGWLSDNDMNKNKLDLFYWLLASLSFLNFLNFLYWSNWYSYNPSLSPTAPNASSKDGEEP